VVGRGKAFVDGNGSVAKGFRGVRTQAQTKTTTLLKYYIGSTGDDLVKLSKRKKRSKQRPRHTQAAPVKMRKSRVHLTGIRGAPDSIEKSAET